METKPTSRAVKGVIIVLLLIATDIALQHYYKPLPDGIRYLVRMGITFVAVLIASVAYARQTPGPLSFGEIFSHGFKLTAFIAFMMALYTFISVRWIEPPPSAAEMDAAVKAIEQQGNALQQEARQIAEQAAKNRWIVYVSTSLFASLIPGLVASLAAAAATKKK